jgi:DNA-directed RNA polymerase specialized sigma24 family protein
MTTFALARSVTIRSRENGYLQRVTIEHSDDAVLVARIDNGDEAALEAIYRKYGASVAFVAKKVRDEALAEDVVQDVFVSFWRSPDRFDVNRGALSSYLLTIAHRRAVDIVRSEEARSRREETTAPPHGGVISSAGDVVSQSSRMPEGMQR